MKKYVIAGVALFLAALFVATIGSLYTGYATVDPSQVTLSHFPYPFMKNNVYNFKIVLGSHYSMDEYNAAVALSKKLQKNLPLPPPITFADFDTTTSYNTLSAFDRDYSNLILVGDTCDNPEIFSRKRLGYDCTFGLDANEGFIELRNEETKVRTTRSIIIVSGYSVKDIDNAMTVLTNYNMFPLKGNVISVRGGYTSTNPLDLRLTYSSS